MATTASSRPTPERIFNTLNAHQQTAALKAGIELGVFTAVAEGANTAPTLAAKTGAAERGVRILCDYLTIQGFLVKDDDRYKLTQESAAFLDRRSPAYMGSLVVFINSDLTVRNFAALTEVVRKGGTAGAQGNNQKPNDDMWVSFARNMAPVTTPAAEFMTRLMGVEDSKPYKVLDIAAGHGLFGIAVAKKNPKAQIVALDWPNVLEVAKENAQKFGVADRLKTIPGSAFEAELGTDYDFVLLTNIFHHFDKPTCEKLMKRVHAALKPGGKAITLEFVPNEDRVSPPTAAAFSLVMLTLTDDGDAYTFSEYEKMFASAGFAKSTLQQIPDMPQQVIVSER